MNASRVGTVAVALASVTLAAACTSSKGHSPTASSVAPSSAAVSGAPASSAAASTAAASSPAAVSSSALASSSAPVPSSSAASATTSAPAATTPAAVAYPAAIWPTYHHDNTRAGVASSAAAVTGLRVAATASLDGAIYASPLVLHDASGDLIIAATENNTIYALRNNGGAVWSRHIGSPVNGSSLPCGDINPSGITGTPAYDPSSGLIFAVAFLTGLHHELVALHASDGTVAWTRPIDPPGSEPNVEQQRAALLVSGGDVWVAYGGLYGDCGAYHGYVVGVSTSGGGPAAIYQTPSPREAGIWAPAGPAADAAGHVYVSVGNGSQTSGPYDMSDSVLELSGTKVVSYFAPAGWASENAHDLDLSTTGPVVLPGGKVFVAGKDGIAYLLTSGAMGGVGAPVPTLPVCKAFGGAAYAAGLVYVPCVNGVHAIRVNGNSMTLAWSAAPEGTPIVGGGVVLLPAQAAGVLYALDPASGAVKWTVPLGDPTTRFAAPSMSADGFAYVGTEHGKLVIVATS